MINLSNDISKNNTMTSLKLVNTGITDLGASYLINALKNNKKLKTMNLSKNLLTEKTLDNLIELFRKNNTI